MEFVTWHERIMQLPTRQIGQHSEMSKHFRHSRLSLVDRAISIRCFVQENPELTPAAPDTTQMAPSGSGGVAKW